MNSVIMELKYGIDINQKIFAFLTLVATGFFYKLTTTFEKQIC